MIPPQLASAPVVADLYRLAVERRRFPDGLHMEFGVGAGRSLRELRKLVPPATRLYGFDSFEGLPEPWCGMPRGTFATGGYRVALPNTELVVGLFEDTLGNFASQHPQPAALIHVDCDLYSATRTVLTAFGDNIVPGTLILFDELFGYEGYEAHEYRALMESNIRFRTLARWNAYRALIEVTDDV